MALLARLLAEAKLAASAAAVVRGQSDKTLIKSTTVNSLACISCGMTHRFIINLVVSRLNSRVVIQLYPVEEVYWKADLVSKVQYLFSRLKLLAQRL